MQIKQQLMGKAMNSWLGEYFILRKFRQLSTPPPLENNSNYDDFRVFLYCITIEHLRSFNIHIK